MRRKALAHFLFVLALTTPVLHASEERSSDEQQYSRAQIKKLVRKAHTAEQFSQLADYYAVRQRTYKQKAAEMKRLLAERNVALTPPPGRWPCPALSLYEYYAYQADRCGELMRKYSQKADEVAPE